MTDIGNYKRCPICKEWGWGNTHRCDPVWICRSEDECEEESERVYANSAEEAAERYLDKYFSDFDYPKSMIVIVQDEQGEKEYTFEVTVEPVPTFSAEQIAVKEIGEKV